MDSFAPIPPDPMEEDRVLAVQQTLLLDTASEPAFDHLVQLMTAICRMPIGGITLIDDKRQFCKSLFGLSIQNFPRTQTICNTTLQYPAGLFIENLSEDRRFASLPLVNTAPFLRAYAGYPLRGASGHILGTIFAADPEPRRVTHQQRMALRILAHQAASEMELRKHALTISSALKEELDRHQQGSAFPFAVYDAPVVDELTGLNNQNALLDLMQEAIRHSLRYDEALSVAMVDLDHFCAWEMQNGEEAGKNVIRSIAALLQRSVRETDIVTRYSRDCFCLLLPLTAKRDALTFAERIRSTIAMHPIDGELLTASIGVADVAYDPDSLLNRAQAALAMAKRHGGNSICGDSLATRSSMQKRLAV